MHKPTLPKLRTANATARLTPDEEERIRQHAIDCGLTKSEWCRQVLLEALEASPGTRLVLSEVLALRTVILRLYADSLQEVTPSDTQLFAVMKAADTEKFNQADRRIQTFHADILKPEQAGQRGDH